MNLKGRLPAIFVIGFLAAGGALFTHQFFTSSAPTPTVEVTVPTFTQVAIIGEKLYSKNCAACHGLNAAGTQNGPPLVHDIYNPGHHADAAFFIAAKRGVRSHHWPFGDMPPQPQVTSKDLTAITRYVRELQTANGIFYRPHKM